MKKKSFIFSGLFAIGITLFSINAFAGNSPLESKSNESAAIRCEVTVGGVTATCTFCNCAELAESLTENTQAQHQQVQPQQQN